jgi:hypothetical protein
MASKQFVLKMGGTLWLVERMLASEYDLLDGSHNQLIRDIQNNEF